ncbi:MAG: type II toxin-antitoxin system RelB/DinJ family antitoxin [Clostridiales bacterium]|nr:type II toxin-antitoxin system RelB/DinJ family antitoxin [Clostridiales bacterium]
MDTTLSVATAPKTGTFQMRMNPEIKRQVEEIYAACGMTLTDAINVFLQQSINVGGLPFLVTTNGREALRAQALFLLMEDGQAAEPSVQSADGSGAEPQAEFGT